MQRFCRFFRSNTGVISARQIVAEKIIKDLWRLYASFVDSINLKRGVHVT